ncbi:hypothetical protein [Pedobacter miscanthi]|uniref:hypothetical protein n=1 Tax=Pedobacter miscanthi TaxID=2259170 RepID=UPI00292E4322|nr:hypothetical protein [Pedobacter miscanthi]
MITKTLSAHRMVQLIQCQFPTRRWNNCAIIKSKNLNFQSQNMLLRKPIILVFLFFLFTTSVFAQKDAPVVGYAAKLVELLKKDYNAVDPDLKDQELAENRTEAIGIFKSFLREQDREKLIIKGYDSSLSIVNTSFQTYTSLKKQFTAYSSSPPVSSKETDLDDYAYNLNILSGQVESQKNTYYEDKSSLDLSEIAALRDLYKAFGNHYLGDIIDKFHRKYNAIGSKNVDGFSSTGNSLSVQKSVFSVPGELSAQMFLTALADILAKRIQEELSLYATQRVQKWLSNPGPSDPIAEFKVLLPQTTNYFLNLSSDGLINAKQLRENIEADLNDLLKNSENLRNTPRMRRFLTKYPEMDFALEGVKIISSISGIKSPIDYFTILENSSILQKLPTSNEFAKFNLVNAVNLSAMLARSLIIIQDGEARLAGMDFIANYSADIDFYVLYVGFLNQQNLKYYNIAFKTTSSSFVLENYLKQVSGTVLTAISTIDSHKAVFQNVLNTAAKSTEKVYKLSSEIRKINKSEKPLKPDTLHAFVESIISMAEDFQSSGEILIAQWKNSENKPVITKGAAPLIKYFQIARSANDIARDLQKKKFSVAVLKALEFSLFLQSDQNAEYITNVNNFLLDLKITPNILAWNKVLKIISEKDNINGLSRENKEAFQNIYTDLIRLDIYAKNENEKQTTLDFIEEMKMLCGKAISSTDYTISSTIKDFSSNEAFASLTLSYYTNNRISEGIEKVRNALKDYTVKSGSTEVPIFSEADINGFIDALKAYQKAYFENYFVSGKESESRALSEKRDLLLQRVGILGIAFSDNILALNNPELVKIMRFIIEISTAENEEGVELALNNVINKTGSYVEKRKSSFNVSINAYPGILPAYELSWKEFTTAKAFSVGFTAPVGLSFSWGSKSGNTDGFFIPLIDIGALTRVRLDGSKKDKALPELSFKNVFAPGLYYSHGFKNSPFAVNIGVQYGPDLKEISYDAAGVAVTKSYESMRVGLGLVLDIPLYGLSNKPRK